MAGGNLEVRVQPYAWSRAESPEYNSTKVDRATRKISLATLEGKSAGEITTASQPTHVSAVIKTLEGQREILRLLQGSTTPTQAAEEGAWETVKHAVRYQLFGGHLAEDLNKRCKGDEDTDNGTEELRTDAEALELIDRVVEALSDESSLKAALNKDTGIFAFAADDTSSREIDVGSHEAITDGEKIRGRSYAEFLAETQSGAHATLARRILRASVCGGRHALPALHSIQQIKPPTKVIKRARL